MINALIILAALNALLLICIILIQNPKGGGIDTTYGGQGVNQVVGVAQSTSFIEKVTWGLASSMFLLFIVTAIVVSS